MGPVQHTAGRGIRRDLPAGILAATCPPGPIGTSASNNVSALSVIFQNALGSCHPSPSQPVLLHPLIASAPFLSAIGAFSAKVDHICIRWFMQSPVSLEREYANGTR